MLKPGRKASVWAALRPTPRTEQPGGGHGAAAAGPPASPSSSSSCSATSWGKEDADEPWQPPPVPPSARTFPRAQQGEGGPTLLTSLSKVQPVRLPELPSCFICPIGGEVMRDPVLAADGVTYDREQIEPLIRAGRPCLSVATGQPLQLGELRPSSDLQPGEHRPNPQLREAIEGYLALRRDAEKQWQELEANLRQYTSHMGQKIDQKDQQVKDLERQLQALEGCRSARYKALCGASQWAFCGDQPQQQQQPQQQPQPPTPQRPPPHDSPAKSPPQPDVAAEYNGIPEDLDEARADDIRPSADCPFRAGPAPRSARGSKPPMPPTVPIAKRSFPHTPRGGGQSPATFSPSPFAGIRAALTPRISQIVARTPRGGTRV